MDDFMTQTLMLDDLKKSGLTKQDATKLGFKFLTGEEVKSLTQDFSMAAYRLPYYNIDGKPTGFFRIKFLERPKRRKSFSGKSKDIKYWQPAKAMPQLYFSKLVSWKSVVADKTKLLYITEGEKKASKACKEGFTCIGLGGVWNWKSKKRNIPLIEDFNKLTLEGREVVIVFDNDTRSNADVMNALYQLTKALTGKGAEVKTISLPVPEDDEKLGLDDYLVRYGAEAFKKLPREVSDHTQELWRMNDELCFLESMNVAYRIDTGLMIKNKNQLVQMYYANRFVEVYEGDKLKRVNIADEWLCWKHRRTHKELVYEPGKEKVLQSGDFNIWGGWGCEPKKGDIKPWKMLLDYVFEGAQKEKEWFTQWLAYPLQNPGYKQFTAVLLHGRQQGTGKSFIGYIVGDIYGDNFNVIGEEQIYSNYNGWCVHKQFVLGEEITGSDRRRDSDRIKNMLTRERTQVNVKYQPEYSVRDCTNYLFTSNHPDAMFLEMFDRRLFVWEVRQRPRAKAFYEQIDKWRKAGGASALFYHLLHEVDCKSYNPKAPAMVTSSKHDMIALSKSDLDLFAQEIWDSPDEVLKLAGAVVKRDLFTMEEIMMFLGEDDRQPTKIALSKALRRAGFRQYVVHSVSGTKRLWALRNMEYWDTQDHYKWSEVYEQQLANVVPIGQGGKRKFGG